MSGVYIYTIHGCPYCAKAKKLLLSRHVPFQEVDVTEDHETRKWLRQVTGKSTVPQTFVNGQPVGGYADLDAIDKAGRLGRVMFGR
jgi:glutaredoxin 3